MKYIQELQIYLIAILVLNVACDCADITPS